MPRLPRGIGYERRHRVAGHRHAGGLVAGAYRAGEVLGTIATLLAKARSSGTTVVYLQHESDEFEPLKRGTPTWQIHPDIRSEERRVGKECRYRWAREHEKRKNTVKHV